MTDKDLKKMKIYQDRIYPLRIAADRIQLELDSKRCGAYALWMKRFAIRQALKKNDLWKEFKEKWDQRLEDYGHKRLPIQRNLFAEPDLFESLDELMDEYMDQIGMAGFKQEGSYSIDIAVSGDKVIDEDQN